MRNDLSTIFTNKKDDTYRAPFQLLVFHFDAGDVWLSDRPYDNALPLIESWGSISTAGSGVEEFISETLQMTVVIWNGGVDPFSNRFNIQDPTNVEVDLYQLFSGIAFEDRVLIGNFVVQDPISYSEGSRLLSLDLVSINTFLDNVIGPILNRTDWPKALSSDVNKSIDLILGDAGPTKTLCAKTPLLCTLSGSILKKPTVVNVYENLTTLGFPQSGYIRIEEEVLHYSGRDTDTFIVDARGQLGSIVSEHSDGQTVLEYITDHTYIIGQGPIASVSDVRAEGQLVTNYTLDLAANPAVIKFDKQPTFISYAKGARSVELNFDSVGAANTAYQAFYAYQEAEKANGAILSKSIYRLLSIIQNDLSPDEGIVVRAFLSVEHWCTRHYTNDRVAVWVSGIGVVGYLSRPNERDDIDFTADVDIYHGHAHETTSQHGHGNDGVAVAASEPTHPHNLPAVSQEHVDISTGMPIYIAGYSSTGWISRQFPGYSNIYFQSIKVGFNNTGTGVVELRGGLNGTGPVIKSWSGLLSGVSEEVVLFNNGSGTARRDLSIFAYQTNVVGAQVRVYEFTLTTSTYIYNTNNASANVSAGVTRQPAIYNQNVDLYGKAINKLSTDVAAIATAERIKYLNLLSTSNPGRSLVERFDLTQYLETVDWAWFQNREVQLQYTGSADTVDVVVVHTFFEVEYRPRQVEVTNNVTCNPVGSISNRPDKVIEYILTRAGFSTALMDSIWTNPKVWNDLEIWDDNDIWIDSGPGVDVPADAFFGEAASKYVNLGYTLDGVIPGSMTSKEAIKNICKQTRSRLIWSAGKVKLAVKEKSDNWATVKLIGKEETQLRSINVDKAPITSINNDIDLFYEIDRTSTNSDTGMYSKSVNVKDQDSIAIHGQRKDNTNWLFDLVRNQGMAADLADYYLWRYGEPVTLYQFNTYLQQFELEKEDVIRLTSSFSNLINLPMKVVDSIRQFGSGKTREINTIRLICESIRHKAYRYLLEDAVTLDDYFDLDFLNEQFNSDATSVSDTILVIQTLLYADEVSTADTFSITANFGAQVEDVAECSELLGITQSMVFEDSVNSDDSINVSYDLGFGRSAFGAPDLFGNSD